MRKFQSLFTAALLTIALFPTMGMARFSDVSVDSPFFEAIEYLNSEGVITGNPDGTFRQNNPVNRAEFVKIMIASSHDYDDIRNCDVNGLTQKDIRTDAWYAPFVCMAVQEGAVRGYPDNTFRPDGNINVAEAAKILVAQREGQLAGSPWFRPYVEYLSMKKAIPLEVRSVEAELTRGQMAEILYRLETETIDKPSATYDDVLPSSHSVMTDATLPAVSPVATFAGGCFWCMEPPYQENPDVDDAIVGYAGGSAETANYSQVGRGQTKHREAVQVTFDPAKISYEQLLDIFWRQIDPTDAGGQFADRGFQYTTAIYYHDDAQKQLAEASKKALNDSKKFDEPIVTEILPYTTFFPAEDYHQDFYKKSSDHYERYKKGSGRSDFIDDNWAKIAALEESDSQLAQSYAITDAQREERRSNLDELSYKVIVKEGTERAFENEYWDNKKPGIYVDKISGEPLYASVHKFDSGTGWPSFWRSIDDTFVTEHEDRKLFFKRTEVRSKYGDSHLGHIFSDGPTEHGGIRHCINSAALRFVPKDNMVNEGYGQYLGLFEE